MVKKYKFIRQNIEEYKNKEFQNDLVNLKQRLYVNDLINADIIIKQLKIRNFENNELSVLLSEYKEKLSEKQKSFQFRLLAFEEKIESEWSDNDIQSLIEMINYCKQFNWADLEMIISSLQEQNHAHLFQVTNDRIEKIIVQLNTSSFPFLISEDEIEETSNS